MAKTLRWRDHIFINLYWLGLSISAGVITPVLLPYLVTIFVSHDQKNTYLAMLRVAGLAVAMLVQPLAGMYSDRSTHRLGRRRPFILWGTILDLAFLSIIGASILFIGSPLDQTIRPLLGFSAAYAVLLLGLVLLQASSNTAQGAQQGLIPDLVPENQRGTSSGVKSVFEILPGFLAVFIGPIIDSGRIWLAVGIIGGALTLTMLLTMIFVREEPLHEKPVRHSASRSLRILALTALFVGVTQGAVWLVRSGGLFLSSRDVAAELQIALMGLSGLIAMAGSILVGVYLGAWVGIGDDARSNTPFIWWVINRLLFLAAVGSILGFFQFFISDVLHVENPATMTTILLAIVALFLIPSALGGGYLADRIGRKRLIAFSGLVSAAGTLLLLFSQTILMVVVSGCILGVGAGTFMASNWALGTDLVPPKEAGRYLGISNLAGAGAGIVGAGIGGPMADFFNRIQPGLGYLVIFAIYAGLFLLSVITLRGIPHSSKSPSQ
ncbi:MAG TPA: MFS transporter [Anaerolineales bacterium]|nr:MFS transporter [Anaerolineales bacterium]